MENIVFYGTRGSGSLTSGKYMEFGGGTSCLTMRFGNTVVMVDCGSGINNALEDLKEVDELHLFVSHCHIDHIGGIASLFSAFENKKLHVWGKTFGAISIRDSINRLMSQSLWPVSADTYKNVEFHEIESDVHIRDLTVKNMDSNHPGGCSLFRFEYGATVVVTAFDFCHLDGYDEKLCEFAEGCTTLIYDGTMTEEELKAKPEWGHSTPEEGARIGQKLGCTAVYITHFGVFDDDTLSKWEVSLRQDYPAVTFARCGHRKFDLQKMVDIGALLNVEKDNDVLLSKIVEASMDITSADGGTLYLLENGKLEFKVMINKTMNTKLVRKDSSLGLPSVNINGKNVCAAAAREKKLINVSNCYTETAYDFSGTISFDRLNGYHTQSVLVIPLIDEYDDVVGVLQLINATSRTGTIIDFRKKDEEVLMAIANQASMAIINSAYSQQITDLLYGFVKVMSLGIDERTPYNANHTRNMVRFANLFFDYEEKTHGKYAVDAKKKREILMSIWLHDIGKILTPIDIMNKDSRLGNQYQTLIHRFERRELLLQLAEAKGEISCEERKVLEEERVAQLELIDQINHCPYLTDELKTLVDNLAKKTYKEADGSEHPVITSEERYQLSIVKGTLNNEERSIMQGHVTMTQKLLSQLNFPKHYDQIPLYAGNHHEFLNGTGYPNHLTEKDLPWPCRLITVCDIFEALIAKDRPYKKPLPIDRSFSILHQMAADGQLDADIVDEFERSKAWENR
ncbi:MAG: GAF domain-containing protein [Clostridia bacterium]|nr:GAF domain-containing protein [Clostridia bacterium]